MRKVKWENVIKLIVLIISLIFVANDGYLVIFKSYQWTWLGLFTFLPVLYIAVAIMDDFYEQIKSMPSGYEPRHTSK